ncbi:serine hydrolase domain-containing protein [Actinoallomurus rhizosphaericola]|uniref:serine hydrolase domain-containing protein n=1 Tax=Actinoallomurus rhizosphaericola TaxID=2952536 RepID=UPI002091F840|nr:serine hydrolase domain-containing protein [Actinoallomurus rhizosphaericola]MCO5995912.1 beta-lactamase family protein [Actinoallomurus rhizosphaericola]
MSDQRFRKGRRLTAIVALGCLGVLLAPTGALAARTARTGDAVQQHLNQLVRDDGFPAALATVRGRDGRFHDYTAGVGDLKTGARVPADGYVRIGSNTKTFTAVVVLQLVGEGKIRLDAPIETYLPNLIRGDGIDGRHITVRQLLQHTSGLPNYTSILANGLLPYLHRYFEPRELLDLALAQKADFAPGTKWEYSNTNYAVAGLLVEKVTGRPISEEITRRVIDRIGLRHTYFPGVGDQTIREPHPHGYHHDDPKAPLTDVTVMDPSFGWAAGELISTPSDVDRFFTALLGGRLLAPAQLKEMRTTVPAPDLGTGVRYGLGLTSTPLSCGGLVWGHGGDIDGFSTTNGATEDGRAATIAVTELLSNETQLGHVTAALDTALCG